MVSKRYVSDRRRSRPVTRKKATHKIKRNKPAMILVIIIILMLIFSSFYIVFTSLSDDENNNTTTTGYINDAIYINALADTDYPVAVLELSEEKAIALELYINQMPITCQNFINLVKNNFYDGMIFHRVLNNFMIQTGNTYPDGTTATSPYGPIVFEESEVVHEDGTISMASTGAGVGGSSQFFICDGRQTGLDGNYAAFGKTIYGLNNVKDIASVPHDNASPAGGGKPLEDIVINRIYMAKE